LEVILFKNSSNKKKKDEKWSKGKSEKKKNDKMKFVCQHTTKKQNKTTDFPFLERCSLPTGANY